MFQFDCTEKPDDTGDTIDFSCIAGNPDVSVRLQVSDKISPIEAIRLLNKCIALMLHEVHAALIMKNMQQESGAENLRVDTGYGPTYLPPETIALLEELRKKRNIED